MDNIIVSRHPGLVDWLAAKGITGTVISHVTDPGILTGKHVYGVLPLNLAALASQVTAVDLPNLPVDLRGKDITPQQMDDAGARMTTYVVKMVS